jgi:uridine phosphorylase
LKTVLAIAAERMEFAGLLRHARDIRKQPWPVRFACSATVGPNRWLMAAHGPGPKLAMHAMEAGLGSGEAVGLVLSMGWCGALHPHFSVGDIFAANVVLTGKEEFATLVPQSKKPFLKGRLISQDRFVGKASEKNELHVLGAQVVEMEAGAVALAANQKKLPFYCVRVVSDTALEDFSIDFNRLRDTEGRFDRKMIAVRGLLSPFTGLPNLITMAVRGKATSTILGDFLADCEF